MLRQIAAALLTPLGLRTIAPDAPGFCGRLRGGPDERVPPGHSLALAAPTRTPPTRRSPLAGLFDGIEAHLGEYGLGSVSGTADGPPPHRATGCPFQARPVAELLRAYRSVAA